MIFLPDMFKGNERFWIIGDNFVVKSYRKHFKHAQPGDTSGIKYFIKDNFEYSAVFCNSRYSSTQQNILARLQNTMVSAINSTNKADGGLLPKYFLVVLDNNFIAYLDYTRDGLATLLGNLVSWIAKEFDVLIRRHLKDLPQKSSRGLDPFFYWVTAPIHSYFSKERNQLRIKFNLSLESVIQTFDNMRVNNNNNNNNNLFPNK